MECKIDGCDNQAMYKKDKVCQKHYFRFMRTGSYHLQKKERAYRRTHSSGYQVLYEPGHPLSSSSGYVYEHRKVIYEKHGEKLPGCEICGKHCDWRPYFTHIDHINRDRSDNRIENLRVLCNNCNSQRDVDIHKRKGITLIKIDGVEKTAYEWASTEGATHTGKSIKERISRGFSAKEAVFGENITHKNTPQNKKSTVKTKV